MLPSRSSASGYQDSSSNREGYRFEVSGISLGTDYRLEEGFLAGSFSRTRMRSQGGADTCDLTSWAVPGCAWPSDQDAARH